MAKRKRYPFSRLSDTPANTESLPTMPTRTMPESLSTNTYANGLTVRPSPIDGLGCFATTCFPIGRRVAVYAGERISRAEGMRRLRQQRKKRVSALDSRWSIDGSIGGNGTEYINHSCTPTCLSLALNGQILIYAICDIAPGEEITVDYFEAIDFQYRDCRCGARACRGK